MYIFEHHNHHRCQKRTSRSYDSNPTFRYCPSYVSNQYWSIYPSMRYCAKGVDGDTVVLMTVSTGTKNRKPRCHCCCRKGGDKQDLLYYPQGHHGVDKDGILVYN